MATLSEDRVKNLKAKKICVACGQKLKFTGYKSRNGEDVYECSESGMFPWHCIECGFTFHLTECFPTQNHETCPKCGSDSVWNEHLY